MFGLFKSKKEKENAEFDRITDNLYEAFGRVKQELRLGKKDRGSLRSYASRIQDFPTLSGQTVKVRLAHGKDEIMLIQEDNGKIITNHGSLTQEDLEKVPSDAAEWTYVIFNQPNGESKSCIISDPSAEITGDNRAFWWALAKKDVEEKSQIVNSTRMTEKAFEQVCAAAKGFWESSVEHAGSIAKMRHPSDNDRGIHLHVSSQMRDQAENDMIKLGIDVTTAMLLATMSGDPNLEGAAFNRFGFFIWKHDEIPQEFHQHMK